jgi:Protein of unknown function (DUF1698)
MRSALTHFILGRRGGGATTGSHPSSILDAYVHAAPSPQNAVDIFAGEWASRFPEPLAGLDAGTVFLFEDERVAWALEHLGDVAGRSVLELGPLEGGHTWQMIRAGARVTAVEANTRAYLKCLIVKEVLKMGDARFLLGDFLAYLREGTPHYDICLASGVLYHMCDPVELIALLAPASDRLMLWTHIYDEEVISARPELARRFSAEHRSTHQGFEHTLHRFEYAEALSAGGFCGGSARYSSWLTRADLMAALDHFGWGVDAISFEQPLHPHGPALALIATQRS